MNCRERSTEVQRVQRAPRTRLVFTTKLVEHLLTSVKSPIHPGSVIQRL